ncbi:MAG: permease-like cell division protein FtsX [Chitinophagales bacterium]|nr:permease-like cell division protein FtsX [Chitinophagales bacterium]
MAYQVGKSPTKRSRPSHVYAVISVTLVLFMLGILGSFLTYSNTIIRYLKENIELTLVIKNGVSEVDILQYQKKLDRDLAIKSTDYVTKEEAMQIMEKEFGEDMKLLDYNPLYNSLVLHLNADYANPDSIVTLEKKFLANKDIVEEVYYQKGIVEAVNRNVARIGLIVGGIALILFLIALTLIDNTIKLSMYSSRFLIKSMQLVGATRWFIIKPFIGRGLIDGVISGLVAIIGLVALLSYAQNQLPINLVREEDIQEFTLIFIGVFLSGIIICLASTWLAVSKYLRMKLDDLY